MSVQNGERLATKQDLADFYNDIRPYMGGIVTSKAGFTPIGTIISVMGTTAPVNYLACDGTVYNIADYTELANYFNEQFGSKNFFGGNGTTTFAVPDLRGEFLRGTGSNSHANQGSGANVGEHQDATSQPYLTVWANNAIGIRGSDNSSFVNFDRDVDSEYKFGEGNVNIAKISTPSSGTSSTTNTFTSRPTNTSVLYCIATKNFYIDPTLDYSTEEKIVGTWIDGSPLYQKVFSTTATMGSSFTIMIPNTTAYNISGIVNCVGIRYYPVGTNALETLPLLAYVDVNDSAKPVYCYVYGGAAQFNYIILQYTKTTT